jgi:hypothetical protein
MTSSSPARSWMTVVQLNTQVRRRDGDAQAEPDDSGGNSCLSARAWAMRYSTVQIYGFVQKPVYQHVNGIQLTADKSFVLGLASRF